MSTGGRRELLTARREVLEAEIDRLAALIGVRGPDVVGFDPHIDAGYPSIEIADDGLLHFSIRERGRLLLHSSTRDPDELLYWSFSIPTATFASSTTATRARTPAWGRGPGRPSSCCGYAGAAPGVRRRDAEGPAALP